MPYYVYIIQSEKDASFYKGFSLNPLVRLIQHNNQETKSTAAKAPWKLIHLEIFDNKTDALKREIVLKKYSHLQINQLVSGYKNKLAQFLKNTSITT